MRKTFYFSSLSGLLVLSNASRTRKTTQLILHNARIWGPGNLKTSFVEAKSPFVTVLIIDHWEINPIMDLAGSGNTVLDWMGSGLQQDSTIAHIHFLGGSMGLTQVDFRCWNIDACPLQVPWNLFRLTSRRKWHHRSRLGNILFWIRLPDHNTMNDLDIDRPVFIRATMSFGLCHQGRLSSLDGTKALLSVELETGQKTKMETNEVALKEDRRG